MLKEITGRDWAVEHAARDDLPARHQRKRARKIAMAASLTAQLFGIAHSAARARMTLATVG